MHVVIKLSNVSTRKISDGKLFHSGMILGKKVKFSFSSIVLQHAEGADQWRNGLWLHPEWGEAIANPKK